MDYTYFVGPNPSTVSVVAIIRISNLMSSSLKAVYHLMPTLIYLPYSFNEYLGPLSMIPNWIHLYDEVMLGRFGFVWMSRLLPILINSCFDLC